MENTGNDRPKISMEQILDALTKLEFPEPTRLDAAKRMSWAPDLAQDMIDYVRLGFPKFDARTGGPHPTLIRPLADGLTVAKLMSDYLQTPVGAFLLGAALMSHHDEAAVMLEKMVTDGINKKLPNGTYANFSVPAAQNYPSCPVCGATLVRKGKFCGTCGAPTGIVSDQQG